MITEETIKDIYDYLASDNLHLCAVPKDCAKLTSERVKCVSIKKCNGFTDEVTYLISDYSKSFLKQEHIPNTNVELIAISDMICNAVSRQFFDKYQIVLYSGLFTLMSHRLIVGQMVTDVMNRCRRRAIQNAEKHINELLNLSYLYGFWIYFNDQEYGLRNVAEILNPNDQTAYLDALGGAMLFIYLHELGHIELNHHDVYDKCIKKGLLNQEEVKEKKELIEYEADQFALNSVKDHLKAVMLVNADLVFDMVNEFELYALHSTEGHPLIYSRLERLNSLLDDGSDEDLIKIIGASVKNSAERHGKVKYSKKTSDKDSVDIDERRSQFRNLLPPMEECKRGFQALCEIYRNMQD